MSSSYPGLGRYPGLRAALDELAARRQTEPSFLTPARVLAQHSGRWLVAPARTPDAPAGRAPAHASDQREALGDLSVVTADGDPLVVPGRGRLRDDAAGAPVTGDWVALDSAGAIVGVLARRTAITRRAAGDHTEGQVLAAGVDLALITEPADAANLRRAERMTALAVGGGVRAVLLLTKADLDPDAYVAAARAGRELGVVDAIAVSAETGEGLGQLRALLAPNDTAVLLGGSGAGKSTLANALLGEQRQATGAVRSADRRGRHTTVSRELLPLPTGALLIDTPGIREVGLWDAATVPAHARIDELALSCRFSDCHHDGEPGCAVEGAVAAEQLLTWRKLQREQVWIDDRRAAEQARAETMRHYRKVQRAARHGKGGDR